MLGKFVSKLDDKEEIGIEGFTAFVRMNETITYTNSVTSITLEDGSIVNDHITNNPVTINISGLLSDLYIRRSPIFRKALDVYKKANLVERNLSAYTQAQKRVIESKLIQTAEEVIGTAARYADESIKLYQSIKGFEESDAEKFHTIIKNKYAKRDPIDIETSYGTFKNCAIQNFSISKSNEFENSATFELSLQVMNIAKSENKIAKLAPSARAEDYGAELTDEGKAQIVKG